MKAWYRAIALCLMLVGALPNTVASARQITGNRVIQLTLIPDYTAGIIRFDAQIELYAASEPLDLAGLPLLVQHRWQPEGSQTVSLTGIISPGTLQPDPHGEGYLLTFGPVHLHPGDRLRLVLPFVYLDYTQIQPPLAPIDDWDRHSRQYTNLFSYAAGETARDIDLIQIPFKPAVMKIELTLVPLLGQTLASNSDGLRFSGKVRFKQLHGYASFSRYCQITPELLKTTDWRMAHLLYNLDFPSYDGSDALNKIYLSKPTQLLLRSNVTVCHYDAAREVGEVEAVFFGRVESSPLQEPFLASRLGPDFPDENTPYFPGKTSREIPGYSLQFGQIRLAPGDVLTVHLRNVQIQPKTLQPRPQVFDNKDGGTFTYNGPASFALSLRYVPLAGFYESQFPAFLRPVMSRFEDRLGDYMSTQHSGWTWAVLALGLLLLLLSRNILPVRWLGLAGWLLIAASLFYGVRGAFGLLALAVLFYIVQVAATLPRHPTWQESQVLLKGLIGLGLIALGAVADAKGASFFRDLADAELSPLTPLVFLVLAAVLFLLLYGTPSWEVFGKTALPVLILILGVLCLYDAFYKSLLALLILFAAGLYILWRAVPQETAALRDGFQERWNLVFSTRMVPIALLVLMIFAIGNDLTSTYANEIEVELSTWIAPLIVPLLVVASVALTFFSITVLFLLVYPYLPFTKGYLKAACFALVLFMVFLFGVGTDERLIAALPDILVGRMIYYLSVPMLLGLTLDIHAYRQQENQRRSVSEKDSKEIDFQTAAGLYLKHLQGLIGTLSAILAVALPTVYAYLSSQPVLGTYFSLLEKLVSLPV